MPTSLVKTPRDERLWQKAKDIADEAGVARLTLVTSTKVCHGCGDELPVERFWKNSSKPDGLQTQCKGCLRSTQRAYRKTPVGKAQQARQNATESSRRSRKAYAQTETGREVTETARRKHLAKIRREARELVRQVKSAPCTDCRVTFHFSAMDLDHVRGKKKDNIATMVMKTYSLDTLREELAKCEVVCSNCHRVRTYLRKTGKDVV